MFAFSGARLHARPLRRTVRALSTEVPVPQFLQVYANSVNGWTQCEDLLRAYILGSLVFEFDRKLILLHMIGHSLEHVLAYFGRHSALEGRDD